jgi:hypothetical protein
MPNRQAVPERLMMFVRSFSTTSRPACGRPPAAAVLGRQVSTWAVTTLLVVPAIDVKDKEP